MTEAAAPTAAVRELNAYDRTRKLVKDNVLAALVDAGVEVDDVKWRGAIVKLDGLVVGEVQFHSTSVTSGSVPTGHVVFRPKVGGHTNKHEGRYKVSAAGTIELSTLLARLRKELAVVKGVQSAQQARAIQQAQDNAILASLVGAEAAGDDWVAVVDKAKVSVFAGKVDLKLSNLTPEQAKAILAILSQP